MDSMILKYLGLAAITHGTHDYLAVAQILLSLYLITNGLLLFSTKESLGKWARRLRLITNRDLARDKTIVLLHCGV
jgi:hypothetical protein